MSRYAIKFPFRVRIHGGEFDESARAIHREDGLKTIQAESGIVLGSTIERKQMSTKTTFKRIALVTVAALGFGVMSVAPSSAAGAIADSVAISATGSASTIATGSTASTVLTQAGFLAANTDSMTALVQLVSYPSAATAAQITLANTITLTAIDTTVANTATTSSGKVMSSIVGPKVTVGGVGSTYGQSLSARTTISVAPTAAGTYLYRITPGDTTYPSTATAITWTVNVTAKAAATAATVGNLTGSTLVYGYAYGYWDGTVNRNAAGGLWGNGENDFTATTTTALAAAGGVSCYVDLGKGAGCLLGKMVLSNGATVAGAQLAAADAPNLTYVVTGPGAVSLYNTATNSWSEPSKVAYEVTDVAIGNPGSLTKLFRTVTDGTPGTITVKITSGTTTIATVSSIGFSNAKTVNPTVVNNPIVAAATNTGTITALVKDETGALVRGATVYAVSSDVAVISNSYTSCGTTASDGLVTCNLTAVAAGTANITLTTNSAATVTTGISATPVSVRVSDGIPTKVVYSFDKDSYYPGEQAKISAVVSNAAGIMPAGSWTVLSAGVTSNYALVAWGSTVSTAPGLTVVAVGNTGTATTLTTIPVGITGTLTLTGTALATVTATFDTAEIINPAVIAAQEATDAASEAIDAGINAKDAADQAIEAADAATIAAQDAAAAAEAAGEMAVEAAEAAGAIAQDALDAANAATDAALSAAEAADAATAAATEAKESADAATAAVAALSAEVAKLMAALTAKVTTLSTLVAKIAKKVKA